MLANDSSVNITAETSSTTRELVNGTSGSLNMSEKVLNGNTSTGNRTDLPTIGYTYLGQVLTRDVLMITQSIPLIISLLGLVGNTLVIIVLTKKRNRDSPMAIYLASLAVSDIMVILCSPLSFWIDTTFFTSVRYHLGCRIHLFFTYTSVQVSSWIVVALTIERVICVTFPLKAKYLCFPKVSIIAVVVIVCVISGLNFHLLIGFHPHAGDGVAQPFCAFANDSYLDFIYTYFIWLDLLVTNIIPIAIMSTGNIIIIRKLTQRDSLRKQMTAQPSAKANNNVTLTLFLVNCAFIVTMTPYCVDIVGSAYLGLWQLDIMGITFLNLLSNVNAAQNFILYFLQGSAFRKEVKQLFGCAKDQLSSVGAFSAETANTTTDG